MTVRHVAETMLAALGADKTWRRGTGDNPYKLEQLSLDTTQIRTLLGWRDKLPGAAAIEATAAWYRDVARGTSTRAATLAQIDAFMRDQTS